MSMSLSNFHNRVTLNRIVRCAVGLSRRPFSAVKEMSSVEIAEVSFKYDPKKIRNFSIIAHIGKFLLNYSFVVFVNY